MGSSLRTGLMAGSPCPVEVMKKVTRDMHMSEVGIAYGMTEPSPGAGSDPSMLQTTATPVKGGWLINGEKWFITGADGAVLA